MPAVAFNLRLSERTQATQCLEQFTSVIPMRCLTVRNLDTVREQYVFQLVPERSCSKEGRIPKYLKCLVFLSWQEFS